MWQGSRNLNATQKESRTQIKYITTIQYISDTEEIVKASWSLFQHYGTAAFKLSERPHLPPPLSTKDLPWGRTHILNDCQYEEFTVIQSKVIWMAHLIAFRILEIGLPALQTQIIQMTVKTIAQQSLKLICSKTRASRIWNAQSNGMWAPRQMFLDWFALHGTETDRLKRCLWQ